MGYDLRATVTGHKRPDIVAENPICFIHTDAAIFAIDEDGVCCYVTSATGEVPRNANRCRGAEYVACLDLASEDGLVAEPRIGGTGLFVGRGATQKMALLRTGTITRVEFVEDDEDVSHVKSVEEIAQGASPIDGVVRATADVSGVKPIDELERLVDERLAEDALEEIEPIELDPSEVWEETEQEEQTMFTTPPVSSRALPPPPPPPSKGPYATMKTAQPAAAAVPAARAPLPSNVRPLTLKAPTPPPRRSSEPAPASRPSAPSMMDSTELLRAALALDAQPGAVANPGPPRPPSTSEIDLGWEGVDMRKTRVGMPIVKLS